MLTPNNVDARFVTGTNIPKPSDLLLHYNFGAAVVKYWCCNQNILVERPNIPRPKPEDPTSKKRYISISIAMLLGRNKVAERKGMLAGVISKNKEPGGSGAGGPDEGGGWDEDDICWDALKYPLLCIYVSLTVY